MRSPKAADEIVGRGARVVVPFGTGDHRSTISRPSGSRMPSTARVGHLASGHLRCVGRATPSSARGPSVAQRSQGFQTLRRARRRADGVARVRSARRRDRHRLGVRGTGLWTTPIEAQSRPSAAPIGRQPRIWIPVRRVTGLSASSLGTTNVNVVVYEPTPPPSRTKGWFVANAAATAPAIGSTADSKSVSRYAHPSQSAHLLSAGRGVWSNTTSA